MDSSRKASFILSKSIFDFEKEKIIIKDQKMFYSAKVDPGLIFSINIMNRINEYK